jgi:hypothetical protein
MDFQTGSPPSLAPSTVTAVAIQPNAATVSWTAPRTLPDATIFWYYITGVSSNAADPMISTNAWSLSQSNVFISGLNSNSLYYFNVQAVNCPGYSPTLSTNTIVWVTVPPAFSPTQLSGLNFWLDASQLTGLTNGQALTTWTDKSANAYVGAAVAGPTYQTNVLNSKPIVRFNGTSQYVDFGNVVNIGTSLGISVFSVFRNSTGGNGSIVAKSISGPGAGRWAMLRETTMQYFASIDTNAPATASFADATTTAQLLDGVWDRSTLTIYQNGNLRASTLNVSSSNLTNTNPLYVGAYPNAAGTAPQAGLYLNGDIAETIVYLSPLTFFDRQKVEGYLAWKWGLQTSLSTIHPFYISSPLSNTVFTPTLFPGLQLWLDATQIAGYTNGQAMTSWVDKSVNAYANTGSNGPTYQTNALNSLPTVRFNGTSQFFNFGNVINLQSTGISLFTVANIQTSGNLSLIAKSVAGPGTGRWGLIRDAGNMIFLLNTNATTFNIGYSDSATGTRLLEALWDRTTITNYSNAVLRASDGTATEAGTLLNTFPLYVGAYPNSAGTGPFPGYFMNGDIGETLVYNRALSTQDRQTVEGYLSWKWGLQGTLPTTHPYKYINPAVNYTTTMIVPQGLLINFTATTYSGSGAWSNTGALGTGYNATVENGTPSKNTAGNGIVFNGTTNFTFPNIAVGNAWSVSLWMKRTGVSGNSASWITQNYSGTTMNMGVYTNDPGTGVDSTQVVGSFFTGNWRTCAPTTIALNTWINITYTWNGTVLTSYANGTTNAATTLPFTAIDSGNAYRIGRRWDGATYILGEIGQVLIYNRALTATEVLQNYNATASTYSV